jgi:hypothetical protein
MDSNVPALSEKLGPRLFPKMDRILARGDGWCYTIATASIRTRGFETQGDENIKAWHQGSGARYLYLEDEQDQYIDWFPTIDPYRMPGTTIETQPHGESRGGRGSFAFVGGSQVGGSRADDGFYQHPAYAGWAQQLRGYESEMEAKLSWFFLGDSIVCLGADIHGGSTDSPVETILENRAVKTAQMERWYVNGALVDESAQDGWRAAIDDVRTMLLPGTAGFVMLDGPRTVEFLRESRSGAWADLSPGRSTSVLTNDAHTAWIDHGPQPGRPLRRPDRALSAALQYHRATNYVPRGCEADDERDDLEMRRSSQERERFGQTDPLLLGCSREGSRVDALAAEEHVGDDVEVVRQGEVLVDDLDAEPRRVRRAVGRHQLALADAQALVGRGVGGDAHY